MVLQASHCPVCGVRGQRAGGASYAGASYDETHTESPVASGYTPFQDETESGTSSSAAFAVSSHNRTSTAAPGEATTLGFPYFPASTHASTWRK